MADIRPSIATLEDGSEVGTPLRSIQEGDSVASKNGSLGFAFKDNSNNAIAGPVKVEGNAIGNAVPGLVAKDGSGNLAYLKVNASGQVLTTSAATGNGKNARGTASGSSSFVTVASLTLANSKTYDQLDFNIACFRDAHFQVILSDNAVETILADAYTSGAMVSFHGALKEAEIVSGGTGTQLLLVKAKNMNALSDFKASLSVNES
jgi:hypothetical protein